MSDLAFRSSKSQPSGTDAEKVLEEDECRRSASPTGPQDNNSL